MSELSVGQLKGLTVNSNVMTVPSGHTLYAPGHVIQVVQVVSKAQWASSSFGLQDISGMSLSITPKSASSKILLRAVIPFNTGSFSFSPFITFRFTGGNTSNSTGTYTGGIGLAGTMHLGAIAGDFNGSFATSFEYLDSPSTTSQINYKVQGGRTYDPHTGTLTVNQNSYSICTLTAMEIAQ